MNMNLGEFRSKTDAEIKEMLEKEFKYLTPSVSLYQGELERREDDRLQKELYKMTKQNLWIARIALLTSIVAAIAAIIAVWPK